MGWRAEAAAVREGAVGRMGDGMSRVPVLRVAYAMLAEPTKAGDLLLVACSTLLMCAFLVLQVDGPYDTDGWFLLATGREIVENGIPVSNPWAYDAQGGEYAFVAQQWLHAAMLYLAYSAFGYAGCDGLAVCISALLFLALWASMRSFAPEGAPAARYACCCLAVSGCSFYMSVRPTMWTMVCLCLTVSICLRWRRSGRPRTLAPLPAVMLFHAQVHMSMMWLDVFAAACFLLPCGREAGHWARPQRSARLPLVIAVIAMAAAAFVNPYGADGALYLLNSYGAAGYRCTISELQPIAGAAPLIVGLFAVYALAPIFAMLGKGRLAPIPVVALWAASLIAFAAAIRSIWIAAVAASFVVCALLKDGRPAAGRLAGLRASASLALLGCLAVPLCIAWTAATAPQGLDAYSRSVGEGAYCICGWEQGEREMGEISELILSDPGRVYVRWEILDSCLEWNGVKVVFDARPEVWEPGITGSCAHPWRDFVDHILDGSSGYLDAGEWRWYVVPSAEAEGYCEALGLAVAHDTGMFALLEKAAD